MPRAIRRIAFLILALCLALAPGGEGGESPAAQETPLPPLRPAADAVRTPPSARVTVAIPASGGQAALRLAPPSADKAEAAPPAAVFAPESYGAAGTPSPTESPDVSSGTVMPGPRALAFLDGKEITELDVTRELWIRRGRETFDWMVGKAVLERELDRLGLAVAGDEIEERLSRHMSDLARVFPGLSSREDLARAVSGMGLEEYRQKSVWAELALRKIMRATLKPTDEQLRVYFADRRPAFVEPDRARISQIFIAPAAGPDGDVVIGAAERAEAERLILAAHSRLRLGEDFLAVASSYAAGVSAPRWVERGELMRELEDASFSLRPGAVSAPIRTAAGYHIIKVEERRDHAVPRFEDVRDKVLAKYEDDFFLARAGDFLTSLKEKAVGEGWLVFVGEPVLREEGR